MRRKIIPKRARRAARRARKKPWRVVIGGWQEPEITRGALALIAERLRRAGPSASEAI